MPYGDIISRGTDPTFTSGNNEANPLIPVEVTNKIIEGMTEKSYVMRLMATMRMSHHLKDMPVLNALPTAYWVTDPTGLKQTSELQWKNVRLIAEELAVLIVIPDVVLKDTSANLWANIRPKVEEAFGKALDEAVLFGISKPASWPDDIKTGAIAAGNTVTDGTGVDIAADVNNVMAAVEEDGFAVTAFAMQTSLKSRFRGLRSTTNEFIFNPGNPGAQTASFGSSSKATESELWNTRALTVRNGSFEAEDAASANAASLIAGDWDKGIIAVREDMNVDFSKSAIINNAEGVIQFNAWQQDLTIGRFTARFAYAVPNPVNRLRETESQRWPWAILRESA